MERKDNEGYRLSAQVLASSSNPAQIYTTIVSSLGKLINVSEPQFPLSSSSTTISPWETAIPKLSIPSVLLAISLPAHFQFSLNAGHSSWVTPKALSPTSWWALLHTVAKEIFLNCWRPFKGWAELFGSLTDLALGTPPAPSPSGQVR